MPAKITVTVDGLSQLGTRMQTLSNKMALKVARRATGKAASVIKKRAVRKLQTNPSIDSGLLAENVVARRETKTDLTSEHVVAVRKVVYPSTKGKSKRDTAMVGRFLEFGTVKMAPEPYMRPAFDEGAGEALKEMVDALDDGLKDAGA